MIRDHVAQRAGFFVVTGAAADAALLSRSDLNVFDVIAIPDRFKHRVSKTKYEDVLNCVFTEVVIDAIDLILFEDFSNRHVQRLRRLEVAPERFLDDDATPLLVFVSEARFAKTLHDGREQRGWRCEIEEPVLARAFGRELCETIGNMTVRVRVVELAGQVMKALGHLLPLL